MALSNFYAYPRLSGSSSMAIVQEDAGAAWEETSTTAGSSDQEGVLVKTSNSRFKPKKHGNQLLQCHPKTSKSDQVGHWPEFDEINM